MPKLTLDQALCGVLPPVVTPLNDDQTLDEAGLVRQLRRCSDAGCTGAFVNGSTGEGPWLSAAQRRRVVELSVQAGTVTLAGTMLPGTAMTVEAAIDAERAGADAVVVAAPYYFSAGEDAFVRHVHAVASAVKVPVILYNIPACTYNPLTAVAVSRLAVDSRVVGIKDSSGDVDLFKAHLELRKSHSFRVMQGAQQALGESVRMGADGLVPAIANLVPEWCVALVRAVRDGDEKAGQRAEEAITGLLQGMRSVGVGGAAGLKVALSLLGVCSRTAAAPANPATDLEIHRIGEVLRSAASSLPLSGCDHLPQVGLSRR